MPRERVIADVTQITGLSAGGAVETRGLWRLEPGERWAVPVAAPEGRIADVYRAAGVSCGAVSAGGQASRVPSLHLTAGDPPSSCPQPHKRQRQRQQQ